MISVTLVREEPDRVREGILKKGGDPDLVASFLELDREWRALKQETDEFRGEQKRLGAEHRGEAIALKEKIAACEGRLGMIEKERDILLERFPNIPADDVPVGKDDGENVVMRTVGEPTRFGFEPRDYLSLAGGLINTEQAGKVSGSRFGYILGDLVLLEFAVIRLALDTLAPLGFVPVLPPVMAKPSVMRGMGKAKFLNEKDAFYLPEDDLYLTGSSEHTIGPFHMDETLDEKSLPRRYVGFSACFRREAGSYGKDTRGIMRVHQFNKVEMFSFAKPADSEREHQFLLERQEELVRKLGLPYRVVAICTGDMGFGDYRQFDVETWFPGENKYRETHSCSNTTDFQSRGVTIRYHDAETGRPEFVHTLNATAFSERIILAIMENYQTKEGSVTVPDALRGYLGTSELHLKGA
ncbi:MAG: serine--tRNA ligase [Candidatus Colwellbacteria bacterium]|nr:serine--tRNA ligase [Candidatus Colwellbacteria bacterium]